MDALLSTEEAAARLGLAANTLRNWRHHGGGPKAVRLGGRVRYRPADLERFVAARLETRTHEKARP